MLLDLLAASGADTRFVRQLDEASGHAIIQVDKKGQNCILLYGGANLQITEAFADQVLAAIPGIEVDMTQNWNRRYRENLERLKSGNLLEVARVVKGLMLRELERGLSTGERKMLHSAKEILISEIVLSQSCTYEDVEARINTALN